MQTVLSAVTCPSDPVAGELQWTHQGRLVACTNYLGVNGTNYQTRDGVFTYDEPIRGLLLLWGLTKCDRPPVFTIGRQTNCIVGRKLDGSIDVSSSETRVSTMFIPDSLSNAMR
jgi:hypothetical protein